MAGTTVDNFDISIYNEYALRTQLNEQFVQRVHMEEASQVASSLSLLDNFPKVSEIDLLFGVGRIKTPWAYIFPPTGFNLIRRSPFSFSQVAPSLGSNEEQAALQSAVASFPVETEEQKQDQQKLGSMLETLRKLNEWKAWIVGKVGQFLQG